MDWEDTNPADRPRSLSLLSYGGIYFRQWRSVRWFFLLLIPALASGAATVFRGVGWFPAIVIAVVAVSVSVVLFVELCSGITSSNWGTYFRRREPIEYWVSVTVLVLSYLAICSAGYFVERDSSGPRMEDRRVP